MLISPQPSVLADDLQTKASLLAVEGFAKPQSRESQVADPVAPSPRKGFWNPQGIFDFLHKQSLIDEPTHTRLSALVSTARLELEEVQTLVESLRRKVRDRDVSEQDLQDALAKIREKCPQLYNELDRYFNKEFDSNLLKALLPFFSYIQTGSEITRREFTDSLPVIMQAMNILDYETAEKLKQHLEQKPETADALKEIITAAFAGNLTGEQILAPALVEDLPEVLYVIETITDEERVLLRAFLPFVAWFHSGREITKEQISYSLPVVLEAYGLIDKTDSEELKRHLEQNPKTAEALKQITMSLLTGTITPADEQTLSSLLAEELPEILQYKGLLDDDAKKLLRDFLKKHHVTLASTREALAQYSSQLRSDDLPVDISAAELATLLKAKVEPGENRLTAFLHSLQQLTLVKPISDKELEEQVKLDRELTAEAANAIQVLASALCRKMFDFPVRLAGIARSASKGEVSEEQQRLLHSMMTSLREGIQPSHVADLRALITSLATETDEPEITPRAARLLNSAIGISLGELTACKDFLSLLFGDQILALLDPLLRDFIFSHKLPSLKAFESKIDSLAEDGKISKEHAKLVQSAVRSYLGDPNAYAQFQQQLQVLEDRRQIPVGTTATVDITIRSYRLHKLLVESPIEDTHRKGQRSGGSSEADALYYCRKLIELFQQILLSCTTPKLANETLILAEAFDKLSKILLNGLTDQMTKMTRAPEGQTTSPSMAKIMELTAIVKNFTELRETVLVACGIQSDTHPLTTPSPDAAKDGQTSQTGQADSRPDEHKKALSLQTVAIPLHKMCDELDRRIFCLENAGENVSFRAWMSMLVLKFLPRIAKTVLNWGWVQNYLKPRIERNLERLAPSSPSSSAGTADSPAVSAESPSGTDTTSIASKLRGAETDNSAEPPTKKQKDLRTCLSEDLSYGIKFLLEEPQTVPRDQTVEAAFNPGVLHR